MYIVLLVCGVSFVLPRILWKMEDASKEEGIRGFDHRPPTPKISHEDERAGRALCLPRDDDVHVPAPDLCRRKIPPRKISGAAIAIE